MDGGQLAFAAVFTALAVSYGWGMRGTIIGGEKGAVLPGALMGLCLALFAGGGAFGEYYLYFAAAGASSMFFGGTETYGQTIGFVLNRREGGEYSGKLLKGAAGTFLKGGIWFALPGLVLAMLAGALAGVYKTAETAVIFAFFPFISILGTLVFNKPFDVKNGKFPKIYFSLDRGEEWGGNVFIILLLLAAALVEGDLFALGAGLCGFLCGGAGFLGGLLFYDAEKHPLGKNKRRLFGALSEKGLVDGWKIMEHTFGAFAGGGLMLYFCLNSDTLIYLSAKAAANLPSAREESVCGFVLFFLLLLTGLQYPLVYFKEKKSGKKFDIHIFELLERPFWSALPLICVFFGFPSAAAFGAFVLPVYSLCEKCSVEYFDKLKYKVPLRIAYALFFIVLSVWFFASGMNPSARQLAVLYTLPFVSAALTDFFPVEKVGELLVNKKNFCSVFGSSITVGGNFVLEAAVIIAVAVKML